MSYHFASQLTMDFIEPKEFGTSHHKLARNQDPDTSKEAAKMVDSTKLESIVFEAIKRFGEAGCTSDEVVELLDMKWNSVTPRFSALIRKGYVIDTGERKVGKSGRKQRVIKAREGC